MFTAAARRNSWGPELDEGEATILFGRSGYVPLGFDRHPDDQADRPALLARRNG